MSTRPRPITILPPEGRPDVDLAAELALPLLLKLLQLESTEAAPDQPAPEHPSPLPQPHAQLRPLSPVQ